MLQLRAEEWKDLRSQFGVRGLSEEKHPIEEPCKSRTCTGLAIGRWAFCIVFGTSRRVFARKRASGVTELSMKHLYRVFFLHRSDYPKLTVGSNKSTCGSTVWPRNRRPKLTLMVIRLAPNIKSLSAHFGFFRRSPFTSAVGFQDHR